MEKPSMTPAPGERMLRFVGDTVSFSLRRTDGDTLPGCRAMLRTNLGKAAATREEIISSYAGKRPMSVAFWRDMPMQRETDGSWTITLPVTEVGYFRAKAYLVDPLGRQIWPDGPDCGISSHPDSYRTANTIYCAFTRMFGESKAARTTKDEVLEKKMRELDDRGFTVIPSSGKLRDLKKELPHIIGTLGCKILHLLPINPTPTTMARMGRFGSPYACQDLVAIDPALVDFDKKTNAEDQFRELAYETHILGGKVFLDVVINHTGWGSTLFETHPEWFLREHDGTFASPGAWGNVWADLVELNPNFTGLWEHFADAFLTWCRRGVDGFRCDAGYKVPVPVWQYIEARVRQEFPDTVFLLEGLGGAWEATENLLTDGGMQWAYSELFQNYSGREVQWYLDYALRQSERVGVYVHYSETHDNDRLAKRGRDWSLLRNQLCGLTSVCGGYGFTCGVEWLADEKIEVHQSRGMNWGATENIIPELARLNHLLQNHPAFFDSAKLIRLSPTESSIYALRRDSAEGLDTVLVLVNTDVKHAHRFVLPESEFTVLGSPTIDLLEQQTEIRISEGCVQFVVEAGAALCLAASHQPRGLAGDAYRLARAQAAWAVSALSKALSPEQIGKYSWRDLAARVSQGPQRFLGAIAYLETNTPQTELISSLSQAERNLPQVVTWTLLDQRRVSCVPPGHWLLIEDTTPFRATLTIEGEKLQQHVESIQVNSKFIACFSPQPIESGTDAQLTLERYTRTSQSIRAAVRFLSVQPTFPGRILRTEKIDESAIVLLTNGTGAMARLCIDLGRITSKYDCVLGANLHPSFPVDRHIFIKRIRVWVNIDGFIVPLDLQNLVSVEPGPPAVWTFLVRAGGQQKLPIQMTVDLLEGRNTTVFRFQMGTSAPAKAREIRLTIRFDIEDRNFHTETHRTGGADHHFSTHSHSMEGCAGFAFTPAEDRGVRVFTDIGYYHHESEWAENIPHPIEQSRGQVGAGDAYSPGWFDIPLLKDTPVTIVACADATDPALEVVEDHFQNALALNKRAGEAAEFGVEDSFGRQLAVAAQHFVVRRGAGKTVIAGYPWFLDWGRDTMISARGLLAAGMVGDVTELLINFGRFVENGTMPNTIHGDNASNRDTSDASLWYGVVCEEAAELLPRNLYKLAVDDRRTIADVLREIAIGYAHGTPNGIRMDGASGLIWSPSHFTWMDTNHPAGTPREGYPIEIQVLWIRLLRQLENLGVPPEGEPWKDLADRASASLQSLFWLEDRGYFADLLVATPWKPAAESVVDNALRSNYLLVVTLGFVTGEKARRCVEAASRFLVVPGALRSLAPLPVSPPLPIYSGGGRLLNNPTEPYAGRYAGDEDTMRKPAYHNGTAWTWTFPIFCEALAQAWGFSPDSVATARAYLGSMEHLLNEGCLGQIPEILDGDAPHGERGCDAQAWGVTEALRVWKLLTHRVPPRSSGN
jgi:starch synthase (maltosyl-transferring)